MVERCLYAAQLAAKHSTSKSAAVTSTAKKEKATSTADSKAAVAGPQKANVTTARKKLTEELDVAAVPPNQSTQENAAAVDAAAPQKGNKRKRSRNL